MGYRGLVFGLKGTYLGGRAVATVALFRGVQKNRLVPDPTDTTYDTNGGTANVRGIATSLSGKVTPNLTISGGYTYMTTKIDDSNLTQTAFGQYAPNHQVKLWAHYTLPGMLHKWSVGGSLLAQSGAMVQDVYGTWYSNGYALLGASVGYAWSQHLQLTLNVDNLTNRYYVSTLQGGWGNYLGAGRSAMLTAHISY